MAPQSLFCASLLASSAMAMAQAMAPAPYIDPLCLPQTQYVASLTCLYPISTYVPTNTILSIDVNIFLTIENAPLTLVTTVTSTGLSTSTVTTTATATGSSGGNNGNGNGNGNGGNGNNNGQNGNGNGNDNGNGSGNGGNATGGQGGTAFGGNATGGTAAGGAGGAGGNVIINGNGANGIIPQSFLLTVGGIPLRKRQAGPTELYLGAGGKTTLDCNVANRYQISNGSLFGGEGQISFNEGAQFSPFTSNGGSITQTFAFIGGVLSFNNPVFGGAATFCFADNVINIAGSAGAAGCVSITLSFKTNDCGTSSVSPTPPSTTSSVGTTSSTSLSSSMTSSANGTMSTGAPLLRRGGPRLA